MAPRPFDVAIVGGGIVGLATALRFARSWPAAHLVLLEKEAAVATHQTGHNSGVIHSGVYYRPGSVRARLCLAGAEAMKRFCAEHGIPVETRGKVIVAVEASELPALEELHRRGVANGVPGLNLIGPERLREIEPHAAGIRALHVPGAAVVDYAVVGRKLGALAAEAGVEVRAGCNVRRVDRREGGFLLETGGEPVEARHLVACAGLHADRLARRSGARPAARIVPFRGEYLEVVPERRELVRGLVYPVPDPGLPFLGVHLTRGIDGSVEAGPTALLALAREGYRRTQVNARDLAEVLVYPGFWRLAARHWRAGAAEVARALSRSAFARAVGRLVPEIRARDLRAGGAGVRAQALAASGHLIDDFVLLEQPGALHVINAPSPAATAALALADEIVAGASARFALPGR